LCKYKLSLADAKKKLSIFVEEFVSERDKFKSYNVETLIDSKGIKHIVALMFDCKSMQSLSIFIVCDFYLVVNISRAVPVGIVLISLGALKAHCCAKSEFI
jgi:hypothetical protein